MPPAKKSNTLIRQYYLGWAGTIELEGLTNMFADENNLLLYFHRFGVKIVLN